jgi:hypothetical protein
MSPLVLAPALILVLECSRMFSIGARLARAIHNSARAVHNSARAELRRWQPCPAGLSQSHGPRALAMVSGMLPQLAVVRTTVKTFLLTALCALLGAAVCSLQAPCLLASRSRRCRPRRRLTLRSSELLALARLRLHDTCLGCEIGIYLEPLLSVSSTLQSRRGLLTGVSRPAASGAKTPRASMKVRCGRHPSFGERILLLDEYSFSRSAPHTRAASAARCRPTWLLGLRECHCSLCACSADAQASPSASSTAVAAAGTPAPPAPW